jgi:CXXX repeat peptide maturase
MKYLNIVLSSSSVFPCCGPLDGIEFIAEEILCAGLKFAEDNNLEINVFYPKEELPENIQTVLSRAVCNRVIPTSIKAQVGDVVIIDNWAELEYLDFMSGVRYIITTSRADLEKNWQNLPFHQDVRVDIAVLDIAGAKNDDFARYHTILANMADAMTDAYAKGCYMHCNLLTDRVELHNMHNCGAGETHITLAPNGNFYVCPAFYLSQMKDVGNLTDGICVKNPQLFAIDYAPICKHCDAYHCKRCVWLNKKLTLEVNTPSHEQCVLSHIERNASRQLSLQAEDKGAPRVCNIPSLPYLDPFENRYNWLK